MKHMLCLIDRWPINSPRWRRNWNERKTGRTGPRGRYTHVRAITQLRTPSYTTSKPGLACSPWPLQEMLMGIVVFRGAV